METVENNTQEPMQKWDNTVSDMLYYALEESDKYNFEPKEFLEVFNKLYDLSYDSIEKANGKGCKELNLFEDLIGEFISIERRTAFKIGFVAAVHLLNGT